MATMQRGQSAGRLLGFVVALVLVALLLAVLLDGAIMAMGGHPVAICALFAVIREFAGTATALTVFVAGLVLLALAGGRSRLGAALLLAGALLAVVPDLATGVLDPGGSCAAPAPAPATASAPPAPSPAQQPPLQPRAVLTPL